MERSRVSTRACTSLKLALATAALTLGLCGAALAGNTSLSGTTVTYDAGANELNQVQTGYDTGSPGGPYVVVQEQSPQYANSAGSNCTNTNPNTSAADVFTVWCAASGVTSVVLNGADQNDNLSTGSLNYTGGSAQPVFPQTVGFTFNGGDGNDTLTLPGGTTTIAVGASGTANGDAGNDTIFVFDGQLANGGDGDDTLSARGPFAGENLPFAAATLNGNAGNDALSGFGATPTPDSLNGNEGDDGLFPGSGPEDLNGGPGGDLVSWASAGNGVNVSLDNVANDGTTNQKANAHLDIETLLGSGGAPDFLTGAPGVPNFLDGFGGNDVFNTRSNPADPDVIVCGDGFVTINADSLDTFDTVGPTGCRGTLNKPAGTSGPTLKIRSSSTKIDSDGHVNVKVGCRGVGRCTGILELDKSSTVLGTAQFVIPNGQTKRVSILPRAAYSKRLKRGKSIKAQATADAVDAGGSAGTATSNITIKGKKKK